jgi:hypothetical protein
VVVINGARKSLGAQGAVASILAVWNDTQKEPAGLSPKGRYVECDGCTSPLHTTQPAIVVDAILSVIGQARTAAR